MLAFLNRRKKASESPCSPSVGKERRVYAIGDIHGRLDLLDALLGRIAADCAALGAVAETHIILLGDLVDRGPDSAGVVRRAMELAEESRDSGGFRVHFLKGNHEEVFIRAARGDEYAVPFLLRYGGWETLLSYGLDPDATEMDSSELAEWMLRHVPREHVDFLDAFEDLVEMGDYVFVHAGVRPQVPLAQQKAADLRWIRDEFLNCRQLHEGKIIVHGHTIMLEVDEHPNRIGIDTGAYRSGRLTALALEDDRRWYLSTAD